MITQEGELALYTKGKNHMLETILNNLNDAKTEDEKVSILAKNRHNKPLIDYLYLSRNIPLINVTDGDIPQMNVHQKYDLLNVMKIAYIFYSPKANVEKANKHFIRVYNGMDPENRKYLLAIRDKNLDIGLSDELLIKVYGDKFITSAKKSEQIKPETQNIEVKVEEPTVDEDVKADTKNQDDIKELSDYSNKELREVIMKNKNLIDGDVEDILKAAKNKKHLISIIEDIKDADLSI